MTSAVGESSAAVKPHTPSPQSVKRSLAGHTYCILATASAQGAPHAVSVVYAYVDGHLYVATGERTKKARNVRSNPQVAVCVPVRRYPVGPPFSIQFQGKAKILHGRKLRKIVGYGVLDEPDVCFIKITPASRIQTYGLGIPLTAFLRDVPHADRTVQMD
jgi:general stress protein 26